MKLTLPEILIKEDDGFSPKLDIFERKEFGERLANLIESADENLVIALDAKWGEGKSTFIKMWRGYLSHIRDNKIKSIYFDAFENDYQKDPFLAIASEMYELIKNKPKEKKEEFKRKASEAVKSMARGALKISVRSISGGILDGSFVDFAEKDISKLLADQVDQIVADKFKNIKNDKLAINNFKVYLEGFAKENGNGLPIIFIIDELDRCRPDFALELLEKIKHLFSVNGITFLLVLNREQLEESIKFSYGSGINSSVYLQKFIKLWVNLPRKSGRNIDHGVKYMEMAFNSMLSTGEVNKLKEAKTVLSELILYLKPSYREIERMLTYFSIILNSSPTDRPYLVSYQFIISFLCFVKVSKPNLIIKIMNEKISTSEILNKTGLENIVNEPDSEFYNLHDLTKLIEYDLGNEEIKKDMIEKDILPKIGKISNNTILSVCIWLTEIKNEA